MVQIHPTQPNQDARETMKKLFITLTMLLLLSGCAHLPDTKGHCTKEFPIKGNFESMVYHTTESGYYWQTVAEWCFETEKNARTAGYRSVKN